MTVYDVQCRVLPMTIIDFANQKGGEGKSNVTTNTAGVLAENGYKVLVIDMDGQGHQGTAFGISPAKLERLQNTVYDTLVNEQPLENCILRVRENIHLAPSNDQLYAAHAALEAADRWGKEQHLKDGLRAIKDNYDFILIDSPPQLGFLAVSALTAADYLIIPMATTQKSILGADKLLRTVSRVQQKLNPELQVLGILATRHLPRTVNARESLEYIKTKLAPTHDIIVFDTVIQERIVVREAELEGQTIVEYAPNAPSSQDYRSFVEEMIKHV